jgi:cytochrome oxidase Cu insertion factor (SCO1/SenC/PrrC family)
MISIWVFHRQCWRLVIACVIVWSVLIMRTEVSADANMMAKLGMLPIEEDVIAPDFTVKTVSGDTIQLSSMKGKVVLLNFWATW